MIQLFKFDIDKNKVSLDTPELLLVKEFAALLNKKHYKNDKELPHKEFAFIYLMWDWKSPYSESNEEDRLEEVLRDVELTKEQVNHPLVVAASKKYTEFLESNITYRLLKSVQYSLNQLEMYYRTISFTERGINDKLLNDPTAFMKQVGELDNLRQGLADLEKRFKKEILDDSDKVRGNTELGLFDK